MASTKTKTFEDTTNQRTESIQSQCIPYLFETFFQLITSIFIFIIAPFILTFSLPFVVLRLCVKYSAKYFRKDLGDILSKRSATFAAEDLLTSPKSNIVTAGVIEGDVNLDFITSQLKGRDWKNDLKDAQGNDNYKQIYQYIVNWCGYPFWKNVKDFDALNHLKSLPDDKQHTEEDLLNVAQKYIGRKWPAEQPMWEVVLIPNYTPSYSIKSGPHFALLLAFHHSIGDGYSILFFILNKIVKKTSHKNAIPNYFNPSWPLRLLYLITFPFRACWELAGIIVQSLQPCPLRADQLADKQQLTGPEGTNLNIGVTNAIPISVIHQVKSHYKTSFAAVQLSVIAGALRDFQIRTGMTVPKITPCGAIVPIPGHKNNQFQNHASFVYLDFGISVRDPVQRLHFLQAGINRCKSSAIPILNYYVAGLLGCFITPITRKLIKGNRVPTGLTSFPAGYEHFTFMDFKAVDALAFAGMLEGDTGIAFVAVSYIDRFRVSTIGKQSRFTREDVKLISSLIEEKFYDLCKQIQSEV